jgi:hypothetical protein
MRSSTLFILAGAALALSACGEPNSPAGRGKPPVPSSPEPPALWSVQTQNDEGKVTKTALICADTSVHRSFSRPLPSPNGQPCQLVSPPVEQAGRYSARCKFGGDHLDVQAATTGDPDKDFTVKLLIQSDVKGHENFGQTLHYTRLGACPDGWNAGDTGAPGGVKLTNSLTGAARTLPAPIQAPAP